MIHIKTRIPGPKALKIIRGLREKNGGWEIPHPVAFSGKGRGAYCEDVDGNVFLDCASQVAANPLGYNHPELVEVVKKYSNRFPIKYAGQDFCLEEHLKLLERLTSVSPKGMNAGFLINSGAEAVENAIKICMRQRPATKFGISMESGWHGRTLGALSLTNSKIVHKKGYLRLPMWRLPYDDSAGEHLERIIRSEGAPEEIGFVIMECVQGEGGYNIASKKMAHDIRRITREHGIPLIFDEVQSGMGRTGEWWAFENYGVVPEVFSSAKALQVGAVVSHKSFFPEPGAISSTWGGGHILDMAIGARTIELIKHYKLLDRNKRMGSYFLKGIKGLKGISGQRGIGLMLAFDLPTEKMKNDVVMECLKKGLIVLGCGVRSVRLIPPYIIEREDIDRALEIIQGAVKACTKDGFKHEDFY